MPTHQHTGSALAEQLEKDAGGKHEGRGVYSRALEIAAGSPLRRR